MPGSLAEYYHQRAAEYERIYHKPERQADISAATTCLQQILAGKTVKELACGTGFWTAKIAVTATTIGASDINQAVIDIAQQKQYPDGKVTFALEDLYQTPPQQAYDVLFGGFIWSHILMGDLDRFIQIARQWVKPGGILVFMDNLYVEGSNHPITRTDPMGNTYQTRKLDDGSTHEVLKNFPDEGFLVEKLGKGRYIAFDYFWIFVTAPQ